MGLGFTIFISGGFTCWISSVFVAVKTREKFERHNFVCFLFIERGTSFIYLLFFCKILDEVALLIAEPSPIGKIHTFS